jgi:proteasome lid subunit RPN8/RPN11
MTLSTFTIPVTQTQQAELRLRAESAYPNEACGFILQDGSLVECQNHSNIADQFVITAEDYAEYDEQVAAIWHTHANFSKFSQADIRACKTLNIPFAVWDCGSSQFLWLDPRQSAGLLQRPWNYGVYDCYSAVRDWYFQELNVQLGDYARSYDGEWSSRGFVHFEENFRTEGFIPVPANQPLQRGDVIMFRIRNDVVCNHVAVVEDPVKNLLFQHLVNKLSGFTSYSGYFRENTHMVVRRLG